MDKKSLRQNIKAAVKDCRNKKEQSEKICKKVLLLPEIKKSKCVFIYISEENEVDTRGIISVLIAGGKRVCIPKITGDGIMVAVEFDGDEKSLTPDKFGIPTVWQGREVEKNDIDLCICPGVAFDFEGRRLGRGGGFYDRFLAGCKAFKVGVCFNEQMVERVPAEEFDVLMDRVVCSGL